MMPEEGAASMQGSVSASPTRVVSCSGGPVFPRTSPVVSQVCFPEHLAYGSAGGGREAGTIQGITFTVEPADDGAINADVGPVEPVIYQPVLLQRSPTHGRSMRRNTSNARLNGHVSPSATPRSTSSVNRSQSVRAARRTQSADPSGRFRQRIASIPSDITAHHDSLYAPKAASNHSLPLPGEDSDYLRLRNFAVTPKGVINRGDSFRSKSRSTHSVSSTGSGQRVPISVQPTALPDSPVGDLKQPAYPLAGAATSSGQAVEGSTAGPAAASDATSDVTSATEPVKHRVLVMGAPDVGKTALIRQFMTSEYICSYDNSQDEENEKTVAVILNGEESELVFIEYMGLDDLSRSPVTMYNPDAYVIVYSVTNRKSFEHARDLLVQVQKYDDPEHKALILVGNKTDLVRLRTVSTEEGRALATSQSSKWIETSVGINHHVDELLVGILSQIRLKSKHAEKQRKKRDSVSLDKGSRPRYSGCTTCKAKGLIKKILRKACSRSKSCDNLHVL